MPKSAVRKGARRRRAARSVAPAAPVRCPPYAIDASRQSDLRLALALGWHAPVTWSEDDDGADPYAYPPDALYRDVVENTGDRNQVIPRFTTSDNDVAPALRALVSLERVQVYSTLGLGFTIELPTFGPEEDTAADYVIVGDSKVTAPSFPLAVARAALWVLESKFVAVAPHA